MRLWFSGLGLAACAALAAAARADSSIDATNKYAYGANVGWVNLRGDATNGVVVGQFTCRGYAYAANVGWIRFGNGAPANGIRYGNAAIGDCGVNHDGAGRLAGFAYGANVGWIQFEAARGNPRIDLATGKMSGYAYGANVGWIGLSNLQAHVETDFLAPGPDTDFDGIPDDWELERAGDLTTLGGSYPDGDDVPDVDEYRADTDPLAGEHLEIVSLARTAGSNVVAWTARPTRLYRVEASNAMPIGASAAWEDVVGGLVGPGVNSPMEQAVTAPADAAQFYRVRAVVPLSP